MTIIEVLDRTNWQELKRQKSGLLTAIDYAEFLNRPKTKLELEGLLAWVDALQDAAADLKYSVYDNYDKTIDYVIIDHDTDDCADGDETPEIRLEVLGYRDERLIDSLGSIGFNRPDNWEVGKFTHYAEIENDHLRNIAREMGLPK